jgi:hypothetical protein
MRYLFVFLLAVSILTACNGSQVVQPEPPSYPNEPSYPNSPSYPNQPTSTPISQPFSPQPGDINFSRGEVFIDSTDLLIMESFPIQIALVLKGNLPTPCNKLRVVTNPPDDQNRIQVEVYSVINPAETCIQVLEPLDANIMLGSFPTGHYSVWVNGKMVGEFDA